MSYIGKVAGRKKAVANLRLVHDGAGNATMYWDGVSQGTIAIDTSTYSTLFASVGTAVNYLEVFDSTGEELKIATGAAASEVDLFQITPGGNGGVPVRIDNGVRLSIKLITATPVANAETLVNFYQ